MYIFFFFKQKTAYEMCGRDWSSDVCSSDLRRERGERGEKWGEDREERGEKGEKWGEDREERGERGEKWGDGREERGEIMSKGMAF